MSLCLTRLVISDFGRYFIKASITFSIHLAFFFWPFRKWNVKLTNQCWWISRKQRSNSQKMFVYSSWPLRGSGFSWRLCDLWERGANWRNTKIIFLGVNFKNYFILFKCIKIVLQANVKDVLCSLKEKKKLFGMRGTTEKSPTSYTWLLEAQLSRLSDLLFIFKVNVFSSSPMLLTFPFCWLSRFSRVRWLTTNA